MYGVNSPTTANCDQTNIKWSDNLNVNSLLVAYMRPSNFNYFDFSSSVWNSAAMKSSCVWEKVISKHFLKW